MGLCTDKNYRILNLYEADFNELKSHVVGGEAMEAFTNIGKLPEEHGSQKGCTAIDVKFDGTLSFDISRQSRRPMIFGSVDAEQCYDRVLHLWLLFLWLALLKDAPLVYVILFCLQNMRFYTRTGYGDSESSYGGIDTLFSWMGLGQGSRGAPDAWLQISSPIFNILRKVGYGAQFEHPMTHEKVVSVGSAFVDDANMYIFGKHLDTIAKVYAEAEEHISAWATMLLVT